MKTTALATLVVMLLILLGIFWVGSEAAVAESSLLSGWIKVFLLVVLALLALIGVGYYAAKGPSISQKIARLIFAVVVTGALFIAFAFLFLVPVEVGLGRSDF